MRQEENAEAAAAHARTAALPFIVADGGNGRLIRHASGAGGGHRVAEATSVCVRAHRHTRHREQAAAQRRHGVLAVVADQRCGPLPRRQRLEAVVEFEVLHHCVLCLVHDGHVRDGALVGAQRLRIQYDPFGDEGLTARARVVRVRRDASPAHLSGCLQAAVLARSDHLDVLPGEAVKLQEVDEPGPALPVPRERTRLGHRRCRHHTARHGRRTSFHGPCVVNPHVGWRKVRQVRVRGRAERCRGDGAGDRLGGHHLHVTRSC
mmetsp:Transcript_22345/g.69334  ORF Transcript_22345/g.69334 Transcript_22345/m.69334 type:complete len:263 (-) Transcript_22345:353-1141(-)